MEVSGKQLTGPQENLFFSGGDKSLTKSSKSAQIQRLKICSSCMTAFYIIADIQHNTGKKVKYEWEAYS
jgi:hypothetical protein